MKGGYGMHEEWTDRLSAYLDGDLPPETRAAVERHLAGCDACAAVLEELREVIALAAELGDLPPGRELWPEIAARVEGSPAGPVRRATVRPIHGGRARFRLPALIAASLVLATVSGGALWRALSRNPGPDAPASAARPATGAVRPAADVGEFGQASAAIAELERVLMESRSRLDSETLRVIDENLAIIDQAIDEVRRALAEDPGSAYLNLHLADTMRRKLQLLRDAGAFTTQTL
jgi:anti-sigma factor RsiW